MNLPQSRAKATAIQTLARWLSVPEPREASWSACGPPPLFGGWPPENGRQPPDARHFANPMRPMLRILRQSLVARGICQAGSAPCVSNGRNPGISSGVGLAARATANIKITKRTQTQNCRSTLCTGLYRKKARFPKLKNEPKRTQTNPCPARSQSNPIQPNPTKSDLIKPWKKNKTMNLTQSGAEATAIQPLARSLSVPSITHHASRITHHAAIKPNQTKESIL